jgi:hypothetical protein
VTKLVLRILKRPNFHGNILAEQFWLLKPESLA